MGYIVRALLLEEKTSHEGPFLFKNLHILFPATNHIQRAGLFDVIRRLGGAYRRDPDVLNAWVVDENRSQVWTCPFCLSFWLSLVFSVPLIISNGDLWYAVPAHFAVCVSAVVVAKLLND